jgi:hypothetical protein
MADSMGHQARWIYQSGSSPRTISSSSKRVALSSDTFRKGSSIFFGSGLRGTRGRHVVQSRFGPNSYAGVWTLEPSYEFLYHFMPLIMGAGSSGTFTLTETLPGFDFMRDTGGTVFRYNDVVVDSAIFRGSPGGPLMLQLGLVGLSQTSGATFPASTELSTNAENEPVMVSDLAITMASATRYIEDFELGIYHNVRQPLRNSRDPRANNAGLRVITFNTSTEFSATEMSALYNQSKDGAAATMVFTSSTDSGYNATFNLRRLQVPAEDPIVAGPDEILLPLSGFVNGVSSNTEMTAVVVIP